MYIYIHLHCIYIIIHIDIYTILYFIERARDNPFCQVSNVASFVDHCLSRSHALRVVWRSRGRRSRHGAICGHRRSAGWESGVDLGVPGDQMTHVSDGDLS